MIREYLGKKVANLVDNSRYGNTRFGAVASTFLDDSRLEDAGTDGFTSMAFDLEHPYKRYQAVAYAVIANAISWLMVLLAPSAVSNLALAFGMIFSKGGLLLTAPALGFTIVGAYLLLRFWFPVRTYGPDDGVVMQSYGRDSESLRTWKLWVASCGIGGSNALLLIIVYFFMSGDWERYAK